MPEITLFGLWLPILVSAVAVFFASFVAHMVLPHHKSDWKQLPNEEQLLGVMRSGPITPGRYMFKYCSDMKLFKDPEFMKKYSEGPHGTMTVLPAMWNMNRNLVLTFLTYLLISIFVAYLASMALHAGQGGAAVFRFTATAGIAIHTFGFFGHSIWFGQPLPSFIKDALDSIAYGLILGLCFMLLWPSGAVALP